MLTAKGIYYKMQIKKTNLKLKIRFYIRITNIRKRKIPNCNEDA